MDLPTGYRFGGFRLEVTRRRLVGPDGTAMPLSARAYEVLVYLIEHRDRVVGKEELLQAVWPRTVVEDNNLNQAITAVRRALGDARDAPRFIVTVAGRGYQFVGDVAPLDEPEVPSQATPEAPVAQNGAVVGATVQTGPPAGVSRRSVIVGASLAAVAAAVGGGLWWRDARQRSRLPKSIAVLPFKPLLPDARNPALELGITELLTYRLSRLPGIVVLPLSSVMRFAATDPFEAGRMLGVEAVVDGHVYVEHDRVRLTGRLLAVDGRASLWANSYTERLGELLSVQDSLAMQLANALTSELSDETRSGVVAQETADVEAWQLYTNGRYQIDRRDAISLRRAIGFFEAALRRDPRFARASASLSDAHTLTAVFGIEPLPKAFGEARAAALRAIEFGPRFAAGHTALGHVVTQCDLDLPGGRTHYRARSNWSPFISAWALMALNLIQANDPRCHRLHSPGARRRAGIARVHRVVRFCHLFHARVRRRREGARAPRRGGSRRSPSASSSWPRCCLPSVKGIRWCASSKGATSRRLLRSRISAGRTRRPATRPPPGRRSPASTRSGRRASASGSSKG
jgi:DNA-binding winged helix-turn-helix (wHTH) protein/TolB-like protein